MPFAPHQSFQAPDDPDVKIWRYMDLAKYISLLTDQSLWFARLDGLGDPWEGSYALPNFEPEGPAILQAKQEFPGRPWGVFTQPHMQATVRAYQQMIYVNCWHMNERESAGMWDLYVRSGQGVAIQSTYSRLGDAFIEGPPNQDVPVHCGVVKYIDYETELVSEANAFDAVLTKRTSFSHEREIRAVIFVWDTNEDAQPLTYPHGIGCTLDIRTLVERVYVAPKSSGWFRDVVQSVTRTYGFPDIEVRRSALDERPRF